MHILTICQYGRNRSRHLAEYLSFFGYATRYGGILGDAHDTLQEKIDWADVVVVVHPDIAQKVRSGYQLNEKRYIVLNVDDTDILRLKGDSRLEYDDADLFQKLEMQMDAYLPL